MANMPRPKKGDKLFVEEVDLDEKACHLGSYMWSGFQRAAAFKVAADIVIEHSERATSGEYRDDRLHPVAYLYRHALELKLKDFVRQGSRMHCYPKADVETILGEHNICRL